LSYSALYYPVLFCPVLLFCRSNGPIVIIIYHLEYHINHLESKLILKSIISFIINIVNTPSLWRFSKTGNHSKSYIYKWCRNSTKNLILIINNIEEYIAWLPHHFQECFAWCNKLVLRKWHSCVLFVWSKRNLMKEYL
jgi:hypothetical protein